jgi:hypothetical protein
VGLLVAIPPTTDCDVSFDADHIAGEQMSAIGWNLLPCAHAASLGHEPFIERSKRSVVTGRTVVNGS